MEPGNWPSIILISWLWRPRVPGLDGPRGPGGAPGAEGIDNKKAAVPWGNFKVPRAEIYVLKRLSPGPEGRSPYRYISRTYRVPGAVLGGLGDLLGSWSLVAEFSLDEA